MDSTSGIGIAMDSARVSIGTTSGDGMDSTSGIGMGRTKGIGIGTDRTRSGVDCARVDMDTTSGMDGARISMDITSGIGVDCTSGGVVGSTSIEIDCASDIGMDSAAGRHFFVIGEQFATYSAQTWVSMQTHGMWELWVDGFASMCLRPGGWCAFRRHSPRNGLFRAGTSAPLPDVDENG